MIRTLLKMGFQRFGSRYNYDTGYMRHIADTSASAGLRLSMLPFYSQFRGPNDAQNVWAGAMLGSTLDGDCGPCVQLIVDMALEAGVPRDKLTLCLQGEAMAAGDVGLGFRFAQAAIANDPELDGLRKEIESRFGTAAVMAVSFAASSGRIYPVLKRGLGFGQTCSRVNVEGEVITVSHLS
ncbi:hypothetical protein HW561_21500 [Rhodobacteraceae bacterium B1Z28]|uniref:Uncharacterized protein n=1 Tax=Ruegeria haliotis TaxID=2747601 RepID=A0ABX2PVZ2_9RHOB|nr:hypothetical protein [Ruegeria haliotis]NVO58363.1 hypothetical protein [Ruegeria haliotis]